MITEDYVSFETAKLLKEKGFDECTLLSYDKNGNNKDALRPFLESEGDVRRPTLQMAMKWLREVHNIQLVISPYNQIKKNWSYVINKGFTPLTQRFYSFNSYEDACEAAINYCLEKLI